MSKARDFVNSLQGSIDRAVSRVLPWRASVDSIGDGKVRIRPFESDEVLGEPYAQLAGFDLAPNDEAMVIDVAGRPFVLGKVQRETPTTRQLSANLELKSGKQLRLSDPTNSTYPIALDGASGNARFDGNVVVGTINGYPFTGGGGGSVGPKGDKGDPGEDGATWYISGTETPDLVDVPAPKTGDFFLYPQSGDVFRYEGGWQWKGSILGPQGPKGDQGEPGVGGGSGNVVVNFGDYAEMTNKEQSPAEYAGIDVPLGEGAWRLVGIGAFIAKNSATSSSMVHAVLIDSAIVGSSVRFSTQSGTLLTVLPWTVVPGMGAGSPIVTVPAGGATVRVALGYYSNGSTNTMTVYNGTFSGEFIKVA